MKSILESDGHSFLTALPDLYTNTNTDAGAVCTIQIQYIQYTYIYKI